MVLVKLWFIFSNSPNLYPNKRKISVHLGSKQSKSYKNYIFGRGMLYTRQEVFNVTVWIQGCRKPGGGGRLSPSNNVCTHKFSQMSLKNNAVKFTMQCIWNFFYNSMADFFYETLQEKDSERCMFIVKLLLSPHNWNDSK